MSTRFDNSADQLTRSTNVPPVTSQTLAAWVCLKVAPASSGAFLSTGAAAGGLYNELFVDSSRVLSLWNGSAAVTGSTLALNQWYHVAFAVSAAGAGGLKGYVNGRQDINASGSGGLTMSLLSIGTSVDLADDVNARICAAGVWDVALSEAQIRQQMPYGFPVVRTDKLNSFFKMRTHAQARADASGRGRHLTVGGTLTTEADPPGVIWTPQRGALPVRKPASVGGGGAAARGLMLMGVGT